MPEKEVLAKIKSAIGHLDKAIGDLKKISGEDYGTQKTVDKQGEPESVTKMVEKLQAGLDEVMKSLVEFMKEEGKTVDDIQMKEKEILEWKSKFENTEKEKLEWKNKFEGKEKEFNDYKTEAEKVVGEAQEKIKEYPKKIEEIETEYKTQIEAILSDKK